MLWPLVCTTHDAADKTARSMQCRPCTAHRAAFSIQTNTADNVATASTARARVAARTDPVTASTHEVWRSHTTHDSHAEAVHGTTGTVKPRRAEDIGFAMRFR